MRARLFPRAGSPRGSSCARSRPPGWPISAEEETSCPGTMPCAPGWASRSFIATNTRAATYGVPRQFSPEGCIYSATSQNRRRRADAELSAGRGHRAGLRDRSERHYAPHTMAVTMSTLRVTPTMGSSARRAPRARAAARCVAPVVRGGRATTSGAATLTARRAVSGGVASAVLAAKSRAVLAVGRTSSRGRAVQVRPTIPDATATAPRRRRACPKLPTCRPVSTLSDRRPSRSIAPRPHGPPHP